MIPRNLNLKHRGEGKNVEHLDQKNGRVGIDPLRSFILFVRWRRVFLRQHNARKEQR
jgi:hypothetical protein